MRLDSLILYTENLFSNVCISCLKTPINVMFSMYYLMRIYLILLLGCDVYSVVYVVVLSCRIHKWLMIN